MRHFKIVLLLFLISACGTSALDKPLEFATLGNDLNAIIKAYSLDTSLLIDAMLYRYELEGIKPPRTYKKILQDGIDFKKQCEQLLQEDRLMIEKAQKNERAYSIFKYYLGHKLNRGSSSYFYLSTPGQPGPDSLRQLVRSFETKYPLDKPGPYARDCGYFFYHNNKYYATVSTDLDFDSITTHLMEYTAPGLLLDQAPTRKVFDSTLDAAKNMKDKIVIDAYAFPGSSYFIMTCRTQEDSTTTLYRMSDGIAKPFSDARYENGKFYSNEGRSRMYIDKSVFEVNELGDLYIHSMHPVGYGSILKKIK